MLDCWNVKIKNQVLSQGIAEQVGFANPQQYAGLFVNPYQDPAGFTTIAFSQLPFNGGQANYQGIDWDVTWRTNTSWGLFRANWTGTQMLKAEYNFGAGEPFQLRPGEIRARPAGRVPHHDAADPEPADRAVAQLADGALQVGVSRTRATTRASTSSWRGPMARRASRWRSAA